MIFLILEFICYKITNMFGMSEGAIILRSRQTMRKSKLCTWCSKLPLTCTVGLRGDCSHNGALMFVLCDIDGEGK